MEFNIDIKCFSCGETLDIIGSEFHTYYDGMDIIVKPCRNCNHEPEPILSNRFDDIFRD